MDEQRVQAHVELIEQLLKYVLRGEEEILETNGDLVDEGLLEMMVQYADLIESIWDLFNSGIWLR